MSRPVTKRLRASFRRHLIQQGLSTKPLEMYDVDWDAIAEHLGPQPSPDHDMDHIRPRCRFNLRNRAQLHECWSPENLRWLHRDLNAAKGSMSEEEFQDLLLRSPDLMELWKATRWEPGL